MEDPQRPALFREELRQESILPMDGKQERLRMAVAMIKQFTRFLTEAPDPAKAMRHFDQFIDKIGEDAGPNADPARIARLIATAGVVAVCLASTTVPFSRTERAGLRPILAAELSSLKVQLSATWNFILETCYLRLET